MKLMPRLASTGPAVKTRNSAMNGRASTHAATACCRRVGSTCLLLARFWVGAGAPGCAGVVVVWVDTSVS
ncbi:hypothetical protein GCM10009623_07350 [Nocardioides aestuarii]